mgnify:CR=1 FL=1
MKHYPYLENTKKVKDLTCGRCKKEHQDGLRLEWQVSWFRGEDEAELVCDACYTKQLEEDKIQQKKDQVRWAIEAKKEAKFWADMKKRLEAKYTVEYLTLYQWRVNGQVDLYITNKRFHVLKTNRRGDYRDMHSFLERNLT